MPHWFVTDAPIRQKLMIGFTGMTLMVALGVLVPLGAAVADIRSSGWRRRRCVRR